MLLPYSFMRPHKSHLINLEYVRKYLKGDGGTIIMMDGSEIELSRQRKDEFLKISATRYCGLHIKITNTINQIPQTLKAVPFQTFQP